MPPLAAKVPPNIAQPSGSPLPPKPRWIRSATGSIPSSVPSWYSTRAPSIQAGAQDHLVPVTDDVLELPQHRRDRLVAHLLGDGDAVALDLAVGVIGAEADEDAALPADQHEFDLAAGIAAADFDAVVLVSRRAETR